MLWFFRHYEITCAELIMWCATIGSAEYAQQVQIAHEEWNKIRKHLNNSIKFDQHASARHKVRLIIYAVRKALQSKSYEKTLHVVIVIMIKTFHSRLSFYLFAVSRERKTNLQYDSWKSGTETSRVKSSMWNYHLHHQNWEEKLIYSTEGSTVGVVAQADKTGDWWVRLPDSLYILQWIYDKNVGTKLYSRADNAVVLIQPKSSIANTG